MRKKLCLISLFIITIAFIYVGTKMGASPSTISGSGQAILDVVLEKTNAINAVTAIVFDVRGFDTLGESIVLLTAVCGTTAVLRSNRRRKHHEE